MLAFKGTFSSAALLDESTQPSVFSRKALQVSPKLFSSLPVRHVPS
jgi:hypothetical protein